MDIRSKVEAIRKVTAEKAASGIVIGGKSYEVHPDVVALLDDEGISYLSGEERKSNDGSSIFVTYVKVLKKSDADFEERFASIYDTIAGEMLLASGIDVEGVNPSLKKP